MTGEQFTAAAKALIRVLGKPTYYSVESRGVEKPRVWLVWGPSKDHYPPDDKVQFGMQVSTKKVVKVLEALGIREEER